MNSAQFRPSHTVFLCKLLSGQILHNVTVKVKRRVILTQKLNLQVLVTLLNIELQVQHKILISLTLMFLAHDHLQPKLLNLISWWLHMRKLMSMKLWLQWHRMYRRVQLSWFDWSWLWITVVSFKPPVHLINLWVHHFSSNRSLELSHFEGFLLGAEACPQSRIPLILRCKLRLCLLELILSKTVVNLRGRLLLGWRDIRNRFFLGWAYQTDFPQRRRVLFH